MLIGENAPPYRPFEPAEDALSHHFPRSAVTTLSSAVTPLPNRPLVFL